MNGIKADVIKNNKRILCNLHLVPTVYISAGSIPNSFLCSVTPASGSL